MAHSSQFAPTRILRDGGLPRGLPRARRSSPQSSRSAPGRPVAGLSRTVQRLWNARRAKRRRTGPLGGQRSRSVRGVERRASQAATERPRDAASAVPPSGGSLAGAERRRNGRDREITPRRSSSLGTPSDLWAAGPSHGARPAGLRPMNMRDVLAADLGARRTEPWRGCARTEPSWQCGSIREQDWRLEWAIRRVCASDVQAHGGTGTQPRQRLQVPPLRLPVAGVVVPRRVIARGRRPAGVLQRDP